MSLLVICSAVSHLPCWAERVRYLITDILGAIWELTLVEGDIMTPISGRPQLMPDAPFIFLMSLRRVLKYFISNGCLSPQYSITHAILRGYLNLYFVCNLSIDLGGNWHADTHHMWLEDWAGCSSNLLYASKESFEILHKQWMSLLSVNNLILLTERAPKTWYFEQFKSWYWLKTAWWHP